MPLARIAHVKNEKMQFKTLQYAMNKITEEATVRFGTWNFIS